MRKTKYELLEWCENKLGTPYVFAAKGEKVTEAKIQLWAKMYPGTYTNAYISKSRSFISQYATDCSGLISWLTGTIRGSSQYKTTASAVFSIGQLDETMIGYALWKSGHIGIYIGNGYCIEAKGINYGTVKTKVSATAWTHCLKLCDIDYTEKQYGWQDTEYGWWYLYSDGSYAKGWQKIENTWYYFNPDNGYLVQGDWVQDSGYWYYLNDSGSLYYGWLQYTDKAGNTNWYYLDKEGEPEGAMVTGFKYLPYAGEYNDYAFDQDGKMRTDEFVVTPDVTGALVVTEGSR